jgi:hypothetical protein
MGPRSNSGVRARAQESKRLDTQRGQEAVTVEVK